jgi:hypothetical protein
MEKKKYINRFFGYFENLHSGISGTVWIFPKFLHRAMDIFFPNIYIEDTLIN